jgi:hypothetical protein
MKHLTIYPKFGGQALILIILFSFAYALKTIFLTLFIKNKFIYTLQYIVFYLYFYL